MRKFLLAPLLTVLMVLSVIGIWAAMRPESAKAETEVTMVLQDCQGTSAGLPIGELCAEQVGDTVYVKLAGQTILSLPVSQVTLPRVTVNVPKTVRVTLPRVTVARPPVTVTLPRVSVARPPITVTLPGVTLPGQTTTVRLPGATKTVMIQGESGKTVTLGVTTVTPSPQTARMTVTGPNGQITQTSVTITPTPVVNTVTTPVVKERTIRVSIPQVIGFGLGLLLLGLGLGLLALFIAYIAGYKDSEDAEKRNWAKFRKDMFGK